IAIEIARLRQFEAREHARLEFLAKAGPALAESIEYETTLDTIAHVVVPAVADLSAIHLLEDGGTFRTIVAYHPDPTKQQLLDQLVGMIPRGHAPAGVRAAMDSGRPQRREMTPEFVRSEFPDPAMQQLIVALGVRCSILAPLVVRGRSVGVLRLAMAE